MNGKSIKNDKFDELLDYDDLISGKICINSIKNKEETPSEKNEKK